MNPPLMPPTAPRTLRQDISLLLRSAPPKARAAILALLPAAKAVLDTGWRPDMHAAPIRNWRDLMQLLSGLTAQRHDTETLLRVTSELLGIADEMAPPEIVLRESAAVLLRAFHADMFVCRLRDDEGEWQIIAAEREDGGPIPLFSPVLEEGLAGHPVMRAVCDGTRHVLSNNLMGMDRGGDSYDCMAYKVGYRSRLAFVLRDRGGRPPFGLVLLYSEREHGFDSYDARFLAKCSRIVALTTGSRVAVARDALEKAAGAVAHHGNNALAILRNHAEYCAELLDDMADDWDDAVHAADELRGLLPEGSKAHAAAARLANALHGMDTTQLTEQLDGVLRSTRRIARIIDALEESAEKPRLMHYVLGRHVLDLGNPADEEEEMETLRKTCCTA
nr:hypothetical protein [Nitratidesulfovibrio sp. SRB-5]